MGRDLNWYVLPKIIVHQSDKHLCFNYEFEKDKHEIEKDVYEKITGTTLTKCDWPSHSETGIEFIRRRNQQKKDIDSISWDCINNYDGKHDWCAKCHMFVCGIYDNPLVIAHEHIGHSYSSPYWLSEWSIKDMYLGSSHDEFVRLFKPQMYYRVIDNEDVRNAIEKVDDLGEPLRTSDKEACEETMRVLYFLDEWTQKEDVYVIMEDEI
jgi:hypothetical protein